jgi:hypothetical protein
MDDLSGFVRLIPTSDADKYVVVVVVDELIYWFAKFGISLVFVRDQGTHLRKKDEGTK